MSSSSSSAAAAAPKPSASSAFALANSGILDRAMNRVVPPAHWRRIIVPFAFQPPAVYTQGWCYKHCEHFSSKTGHCLKHQEGTVTNPIILD